MITVDARGKQCPIPVIMAKKAIEGLGNPDTLEVLVDNETAVGNVTRLANSLKAAVASEKLAEKEYRLTITVDALPGADTAYYATQFGYPKGDDHNVKALLEQMERVGNRRAALVSTLVALRSAEAKFQVRPTPANQFTRSTPAPSGQAREKASWSPG